VLKAIQKFEHNHRLLGLHLEKLSGYENMWSIRVSLSFWVLLARTDEEARRSRYSMTSGHTTSTGNGEEEAWRKAPA
jgi:hypothetical protein